MRDKDGCSEVLYLIVNFDKQSVSKKADASLTKVTITGFQIFLESDITKKLAQERSLL